MSETKTHTPGPWAVNKGRIWVCTVGNNGDDPAVFSTVDVEDGQPFPFGSKLADAHLIAAAPAMAEALQDMLAGWKYIRLHHGDLYGVGWDRAQSKAEAALALARGETK